jgi:hypothetical protein
MIVVCFSFKTSYFSAHFLHINLNTKHTRADPYFPGQVVLSGQNLTLGLLASITLEVVPFSEYKPLPVVFPLF